MVHPSIRDGLRVEDKLYIKKRLFGVGGFPFLLSLVVLLYSNATDNLETGMTFVWF